MRGTRLEGLFDIYQSQVVWRTLINIVLSFETPEQLCWVIFILSGVRIYPENIDFQPSSLTHRDRWSNTICSAYVRVPEKKMLDIRASIHQRVLFDETGIWVARTVEELRTLNDYGHAIQSDVAGAPFGYTLPPGRPSKLVIVLTVSNQPSITGSHSMTDSVSMTQKKPEPDLYHPLCKYEQCGCSSTVTNLSSMAQTLDDHFGFYIDKMIDCDQKELDKFTELAKPGLELERKEQLKKRGMEERLTPTDLEKHYKSLAYQHFIETSICFQFPVYSQSRDAFPLDSLAIDVAEINLAKLYGSNLSELPWKEYRCRFWAAAFNNANQQQEPVAAASTPSPYESFSIFGEQQQQQQQQQ